MYNETACVSDCEVYSGLIERFKGILEALLICLDGEFLCWSRQDETTTGDKPFWGWFGSDLGTFSRKLDLIVNELDMREECPVTLL